MGSVPGDTEFSSNPPMSSGFGPMDPPMASDFGPMRQDLGSVPKHRPEFGSLGHIGSGFSPGPGPMGSLRQDLGSVPKPDIPLSRPEMGSILSSGRRLTVPVTYEDSGIGMLKFQFEISLQDGDHLQSFLH